MNSRSLEMTDLPPRHRRGFALVVTLCLMVLLTVIAVGLLTMSASTTRATSSEQTQAAARAKRPRHETEARIQFYSTMAQTLSKGA